MTALKVLILPEWARPFTTRVRERFPDVQFVEAHDADTVSREIADAEVVFGYLSGSQFESAHALRWIQTLDAGMEGLYRQIPNIAESDVLVTNAQGAGAPQIGEHAISLMLAFSRGLDRFMAKQRDRRWDQDYGLSIVQMAYGKTAGIIGLGKSGMEIAWRCKALGLNVLAVDKYDVDGEPVIEDVWSLDRIGDLMTASDFVFVTVPYSPENENLIGANDLARMKPSAYLIVTSRGRIVEPQALLNALKERRIAGAGLDVVAQEPLPPGHELWDLDNVIITPHIAGNSPELDERTFHVFEENLLRYLKGQPLRNVVDKGLRY